MKPLRLIPIAATFLVLLLIAGVAWAHTVEFQTRVRIRVSDTRVSAGDRVRVTGHLRSPTDACERHSKVKLIRVGVGVWDKDKTDRKGKYAFTVKPDETAEWRVKFPGKVLNAVHPHNHTCAKSTSETVKIKVA